MKQEWPTITLPAEDDEVKGREDRDELPGRERQEDRDRMPGAPRQKIENDDPNAAENQPEPGGDESAPGVT